MSAAIRTPSLYLSANTDAPVTYGYLHHASHPKEETKSQSISHESTHRPNIGSRNPRCASALPRACVFVHENGRRTNKNKKEAGCLQSSFRAQRAKRGVTDFLRCRKIRLRPGARHVFTWPNIGTGEGGIRAMSLSRD